jgi:hypothetical protein
LQELLQQEGDPEALSPLTSSQISPFKILLFPSLRQYYVLYPPLQFAQASITLCPRGLSLSLIESSTSVYTGGSVLLIASQSVCTESCMRTEVQGSPQSQNMLGGRICQPRGLHHLSLTSCILLSVAHSCFMSFTLCCEYKNTDF